MYIIKITCLVLSKKKKNACRIHAYDSKLKRNGAMAETHVAGSARLCVTI